MQNQLKVHSHLRIFRVMKVVRLLGASTYNICTEYGIQFDKMPKDARCPFLKADRVRFSKQNIKMNSRLSLSDQNNLK